jgi:hypothetical protein
VKLCLATLCVLAFAGCTALDYPTPIAVMAIGPADITISPPNRITFDDIESVGTRYHPVFGSTESIHHANGPCCRFGGCTGARFPAVIDVGVVFDHIEEYRRLRASGLPTDSADYVLMLSRANDKFAQALGKYLTDSRLYDTVFEKGTIRLAEGTKAKGIPDVTDEVLRLIK